MNSWDKLHLRNQSSPFALLREIHTHVQSIPVYWTNHTHTRMSNTPPLVPNMKSKKKFKQYYMTYHNYKSTKYDTRTN